MILKTNLKFFKMNLKASLKMNSKIKKKMILKTNLQVFKMNLKVNLKMNLKR